MNPGDPLSQLRDIHLPDTVSWWPPAPGWWAVAIIVVAAVIAGLYCIRRILLRNRYRKIALKKLHQLSLSEKGTTREKLEHISVILRRVAIQSYGRQVVSPLAGDEWLKFLDKTGTSSRFSNGPARVLGAEMYRQSVEADIGEVLDCAEKWIKEHRA